MVSTIFAKRLRREQNKLLDNRIILSSADKDQHLIVEVRDRDLFDRQLMLELYERPVIQMECDNAEAYFTKHLAEIESFDAASGGLSEKQEYESTNASTNFKIICAARIKGNKAMADKEL